MVWLHYREAYGVAPLGLIFLFQCIKYMCYLVPCIRHIEHMGSTYQIHGFYVSNTCAPLYRIHVLISNTWVLRIKHMCPLILNTCAHIEHMGSMYQTHVPPISNTCVPLYQIHVLSLYQTFVLMYQTYVLPCIKHMCSFFVV